MSTSEAILPKAIPGFNQAYYAMRTLRILEILALAPASATRVGEAINVHPRTVRRQLAQFVAEDWVTRDAKTKRYSLNGHLASVAIQSVTRSAFVRDALPVLASLAAELEARADLFIPSYVDVASIANANQQGVAEVSIGSLKPSHCSAPGHVLLAFRESWFKAVLDQHFERRTGIDPAEVEAILTNVRDRGWAAVSGNGGLAVAVPVWHRKEAVAALRISHSDEANPEHAVACLLAASRSLGEPPPLERRLNHTA
jgi:DNA-binding IclR family transcriptional regulator